MKTNILGLLYIILSSFFFINFALTLLILFTDPRGMSPVFILLGLLSGLFGIFSFIFGSALRRHKKWTWYVGIVLIPTVLIGNIITLFLNSNLFLLVGIAIDIFAFYALISEKKLFLINNTKPIVNSL